MSPSSLHSTFFLFSVLLMCKLKIKKLLPCIFYNKRCNDFALWAFSKRKIVHDRSVQGGRNHDQVPHSTPITRLHLFIKTAHRLILTWTTTFAFFTRALDQFVSTNLHTLSRMCTNSSKEFRMRCEPFYHG